MILHTRIITYFAPNYLSLRMSRTIIIFAENNFSRKQLLFSYENECKKMLLIFLKHQ